MAIVDPSVGDLVIANYLSNCGARSKFPAIPISLNLVSPDAVKNVDKDEEEGDEHGHPGYMDWCWPVVTGVVQLHSGRY